MPPAVSSEALVRNLSPAMPCLAKRILIITASVGAGHDGPAGEIARRLENAGHHTKIVDLVTLIPGGSGRVLRSLFKLQLRWAPHTWGKLFRALDGRPQPPRSVMRLIAAVGKKLVSALRDFAPDAIISTYPLGGLIIDHTRRYGISAPLITYITDPAAHHIWMSENSHYLATWTATATEIWRHGPASISVVPPAVGPNFGCATSEGQRLRLRTELGLPAGPLALLTSGSWGVGDVGSSARDIRDIALVTPLVVCGRNRKLFRDLSAEPGMIVIGWTDRMPDLMRVCDLAVLNSGGLTLAEANVSGLPVIHYRPLPGQGVANAEVAENHGIAGWPKNTDQLGSAVAAAIKTRMSLIQQDPHQQAGHDQLLAAILWSCNAERRGDTAPRMALPA